MNHTDWIAEDDEQLRDAVIKTCARCNCMSAYEISTMNWGVVLEYMTKTWSEEQCEERWKLIKDNTVKGPWSEHEDNLLKALVHKLGPKKWSNIANYVPGRKGKQCRERWLNHLDPTLKKSAWTEEELNILIEAQSQQGNSWSRIAKLIPGRSENAVKNQWNSLMHRHWSKMLKTKDDQKSVKNSTIKKKSKKATIKSKATTSKRAQNKTLRKTTNTNGSPSTTTKKSNSTAIQSNNMGSSRTSSKRKMTKKLAVKRMKRNATPRISARANPMFLSTSSSGVKRRQRPKMSRTHSPVYVRVPAVLSHNTDNNGLLRLTYGAFAKSKYLPRIPSAPSLAIMRSRQTMAESKEHDDGSDKELNLLNDPNCWKRGKNCALEMTNGFLQDEMQRSRLFSMVRLNQNEMNTSRTNAYRLRRSILNADLKMLQQHLPPQIPGKQSSMIQKEVAGTLVKTLHKGTSPGGKLSVSVNLMSIGGEPTSAEALMMLQHSGGKVATSVDTSNHSNKNMVSLHQGTTPRLTQLDDNSFPMSTVSPLFRNGMSPAAARFRNRPGFKQDELGVITTTQESQQKKSSLKRSAMSPMASRLMQMRDDLKNGAITQEQKISMKKDLIRENLSVRTGNNGGQQVGKTKLSDNFRGMVKGSGSPLPKRLRRSDLSKDPA